MNGTGVSCCNREVKNCTHCFEAARPDPLSFLNATSISMTPSPTSATTATPSGMRHPETKLAGSESPRFLENRVTRSWAWLDRNRSFRAILLSAAILRLPASAVGQTAAPAYVEHVVAGARRPGIADGRGCKYPATATTSSVPGVGPTEAAYQFTSADLAASTKAPRSLTSSLLAGDNRTVAAPRGVAPDGTFDLRYSPLGIGDLLVQDVRTNLATGALIGSVNPARYPLGYDFFPTIPNYPSGTNGQPTNAIARSVVEYVSSVLKTGNIGLYGLSAWQVFGHPDTPYHGDPRLVPILFHAMEKEYDSYLVIADGPQFPERAALALQYLLICARYPDLILPSVKQRWEACIYNQISKYYNYNASSSDIASQFPARDRPFLSGGSCQGVSKFGFQRRVNDVLRINRIQSTAQP